MWKGIGDAGRVGLWPAWDGMGWDGMERRREENNLRYHEPCLPWFHARAVTCCSWACDLILSVYCALGSTFTNR